MDCCNYGEYSMRYGSGAAPGGWDGYGAHYPHMQYAPYNQGYYGAHTHDPYSRYNYRHDFAARPFSQMDHGMQLDYAAYNSKDVRVRRSYARQDTRTRTQNFSATPTTPFECGVQGRGLSQYEANNMWHHYQMGVVNGSHWNSGAFNNGWSNRPLFYRNQMRYSDHNSAKTYSTNTHPYEIDGRCTPYSGYGNSSYSSDSCVGDTASGSGQVSSEPEKSHTEALPSPIKKRPTIVPLPAFQQAFGSTEIGKFAEEFSRTEAVFEETSDDTFSYDSYTEWEESYTQST